MAPFWIVLVAAIGIDVGWQPFAGGGMELIVQVDPQTAEQLLSGEEIGADLPSNVRDVRSITVRVGQGEVPRLTPNAAQEPTAAQGAIDDGLRFPAAAEATPHETNKEPAPEEASSDQADKAAPNQQRAGESAPKTIYSTPMHSAPQEREPADQQPTTEQPATKQINADQIGTEQIAQTPASSEESAEANDGGNTAINNSDDNKRAEQKVAYRGDVQSPASSPSDDLAEQQQSAGQGGGATTPALSASGFVSDLERRLNQNPWVIPAAAALLFASIGANVFLSWVTWDARGRYRRLQRRYDPRRRVVEPVA